MGTLVKIHFLLHILAGTVTLITGPLAIFYNFKNAKAHRKVGKLFFYAMLYVCASAIMGYVRRPDLVFYEFLLGISFMVLAGIFRGVRSIQFMQGKQRAGAFDWAYTLALGLTGIAMLWRSATLAGSGNPDYQVFVILFAVFGVGSLSDITQNVRLLRNPEAVHRLDWYRLHVQSMIGAFMASTTAFTVNVASDVLPWFVAWFGPTLLLLPLQFYYGRLIKGWKQRAVAKPAPAQPLEA